MKKQLLIFGLFFTTCAFSKETSNKELSAQDLAEHSQKWAKQTVQKLNKEELQLLANYLYFSFLSTRYEYIIRTSFIQCQNQLTAMQFLSNTREADTYKSAEVLKKQLDLLTQEAIALRTYASKAAQVCFEYIEDSNFEELKKVIVKFHNYSSSAINQFIQQDWPKAITKLFSTCAENMKKESEKLAAFQNDMHVKANLDSSSMDNLEMFGDNFHQAINIADASYASYLTLISHTLNVKSMSADILNISALINNFFYNNLLENMRMTKKMNACPIMFDQNGFIEEEDQDEILLPLDEKFAVNKKHINPA